MTSSIRNMTSSLRADAAEHALRALELEQEAIRHCTSLSSPDYQRLMRESVAEQAKASCLSRTLLESDSYPYLALSRKIGAEYGDVLSYVDMLQLCEDTLRAPLVPETIWHMRALERLTLEQRRVVAELWESWR